MIGVRSSLYTALMRRGKDPTSVDPWYFPTVRQYTRVLQQDAGLEVQEAVLVPRLTPLPKTKGLVGWLEVCAIGARPRAGVDRVAHLPLY